MAAGSTARAASSSAFRPSYWNTFRRKRTATTYAVVDALAFLTDVWLVDVATDYAGKCLIIAAALTLIERTLLPERPGFFVTAGQRGGGKTTLLSMLMMAVPACGRQPPRGRRMRKSGAKRCSATSWKRCARHHLGQYPPRHADYLPAHRSVTHGKLEYSDRLLAG